MPKKIPFHRRLLPWLFAIIFLIFAPILVFYTAGYRWNPKKGVVERNGTVIVDTKPTGADIYLNRQKSEAKTPATLQNTAPGTYLIQLEKEGYHPWKKTLSVLPEMVTFANKIILWPVMEPEKIEDSQITKLFSSPDNKVIAGFKRRTENEQEIFVYEKGATTKTLRINSDIKPLSASWNQDATAAIVRGYASDTMITWLMTLSPLQFTALPEGSYHFEKSELVGMDNNFKISLNKNGSLAKSNGAQYTVDEYGDYAIKKMPAEDNLILVTAKNAEEGLILPRGNWRFYALDKNEILLNDGNEWLKLSISAYPFTSTQAKADKVYPLTLNKQTVYLLTQSNELYIWEPEKEPELLYRQSEVITGAGWHPQGFDIFYATQNEIRMLNLDNRDGRMQTTLASFDLIYDAVFAEDGIYIAGKKSGMEGFWKLPLTKPEPIVPLGSTNDYFNAAKRLHSAL